MNQANPISSSLRILSAFMEVLATPSEHFLYSARWVDTQRPRAVFPLYLVGTWQLPNLALYNLSSFYSGERLEKSECEWIGAKPLQLPNNVCKLTNFSSQLACPFRFAQRKPTACRRSNRESVRDDDFPSIRFFCSIRCWWCVQKRSKLRVSWLTLHSSGLQVTISLTLFTQVPRLGLLE